MIFLIILAVLIISFAKGKVVFGVISLVILALYSLYYAASKENKEKNARRNIVKQADTSKQVNIIVRSSSEEDDTYYTGIAGVQYHNSTQDIGGFLGYIRSEPDNPRDKNALAIYRNDNKLIGYLPKSETNTFRNWSQKENLPCIGFIKDGDEVPLFGKVKIIDTDTEETELIVVKYVRWLVSNFGIKFIPVGFDIDTDNDLRTKQDWLLFLDEYIGSKENSLYDEI